MSSILLVVNDARIDELLLQLQAALTHKGKLK